MFLQILGAKDAFFMAFRETFAALLRSPVDYPSEDGTIPGGQRLGV
jgi:hypothetical protein